MYIFYLHQQQGLSWLILIAKSCPCSSKGSSREKIPKGCCHSWHNMPQQQWCSIWDSGAELPGLVAISSLGDVVLVNKMPATKYNRTQGVTPWLCEHTEDLTADRTHLVEMHTRFTSSVPYKNHNRKPPPCLPDGFMLWNAATLNVSRLQQSTTQCMGLVMLSRSSQTSEYIYHTFPFIRSSKMWHC